MTTHTVPGAPPPHMAAGTPSVDLAAENQALRARMAYLLEQAERNHSIMCRHQAFDLEIVGAATFPELVGSIFRTLPIISELDAVTLTLIDDGADIRNVMLKLDVVFEDFPDLIFVEELDELGFDLGRRNAYSPTPKPLMGMYDAQRHALQPGRRMRERTSSSTWRRSSPSA